MAALGAAGLGATLWALLVIIIRFNGTESYAIDIVIKDGCSENIATYRV